MGQYDPSIPHHLRTPRVLNETLGIHHKRLAYILLKWADRGWYDYGVNVELGWLTPEGFVRAVLLTA